MKDHWKKRMDWGESYNKCVLKKNNNKIAFKSEKRTSGVWETQGNAKSPSFVKNQSWELALMTSITTAN